MGQPRSEGEVTPAIVPYSPEWWARFVAELTTRLHTPAPEQAERPREPHSEAEPKDESLRAQADRVYGQAVAEGRVTPRLRSPSPAPAPPSELPTMIETPENLEAFRQAGKERARARLARAAAESLESPDASHGPK